MNKTRIVISAIVIFAVIIAVLMYNKSRMAAKSKGAMLSAVPVTVHSVERQQLSSDHSFVGTVSGNNDVAVVSETQGKITSVAVNVGDRVNAGTVLMQVDDELKKAAFLAAEVNYEKAGKDLERQEALFREKSTTDAQLEGARLAFKSVEAQYILAKRQYNDTKIATPIAGIVTARSVNVGAYVQSGNVVANVVDIASLKIRLNVAENDVFKLRVGETVAVTTEVYPGETFQGVISTISSKGDDAHTYPVEVKMKNSETHPLKAGMFARVSFTSMEQRNALTIPRQALVGSVKNPKVFVVSKNTASLRDIVIASENGNMLEVSRGLSEGDIVVTNGQNNLKDGATVEIVK
jgi:RND family efflux transporter MFP subunit